MKQQTSPEKIDLFKNTFRASMPLTDDYVFHAVFGRDTEESRAALIEILNIILERKQDPIRAIVIKNPIEIPDREADKESVIDIRAETESGELLDIEMQAGDLQFYQNRALFYGGRLVNSALQVGENYDRMKKSIVISITKGRLFPSLEDCHNIFEVRDRKRGLLLCDRLELHFLELCKIDDQKPVHALTEIERLGAYLKFANIENRQDYVKQILTMEDIDMTENAYRKVTEDEREYERREARFKYQLQRNTELYVAYSRLEKAMELYQSADDDLEKNFNRLLEGVNENFRKRNISMLEFVDYYESYKETSLQLYETRKDVFLAMENLNTVVGRNIFNY